MKKLLMCLALLAIVGLSSCDDKPGLNSNLTYQGVRTKYPKARIFHEGDSKYYSWIVIDTDNLVYHVETGNVNNPDVTHSERMTELK